MTIPIPIANPIPIQLGERNRDMGLALIQLVVGFALLSGGAELLVRGAAGLSIRMGITPLVVGLTVVAFGTSSPELVVSVQDALRGEGQIALGTVIGSNICNILLILGAASLAKPLSIHLQILRVDLPILTACTVFVAVVISFGSLPRWFGVLLLVGISSYTALTIYLARREQGSQPIEFDSTATETPHAMPVLFLFVGIGAGLLAVGSTFMLQGAVTVARHWGVSQSVIGLTVVALGGSLPEFATSLLAGMKGKGDIAVGNVVGSNIFNLLCVLGAASVARPLIVTGINNIDLIMMVAVTILVIPLMYTGCRLGRREGGMMLIAYAAYVVYLFAIR